MAIWPFNRKKKESDLPKEVQDYYQAEKRERVGVAGLLAVATLLVTVVLAIGLFFGGRWLYRAIFDDNDTSTDTAQQAEQNDDQQEDGAQPEESDSDQSDDDQSDESQDNPDSENDSDEEALPGQPEETTPSTPAPTTPSTPPSNSDSNASNSPDTLASTGPEDTAAIVVGVAAISGTGFYLVRRKQEQ